MNADVHSNESSRIVAERTCVGCKVSAARDELLRVVSIGEPPQWVPDIRRRLPGRGMSVHPSRRCLKLAFKQGRFRVSSNNNDVSAASVADVAAWQYRRRIEGLLSSARRARQLAIGTEAVRESLEQRTLRLLVVASDAAGSRGDLEQVAARLGRACLVLGSKTELGAMLGRETVGVVGVLDEAIGEELRSAAQHIGALAEDA